MQEYYERIGSPCSRCGEDAPPNPGWMGHGGDPICERCSIEHQLDHATEQASKLPQLRRKMAEMGGRLRPEDAKCGHIQWVTMGSGDASMLGKYCWLKKGHDAKHQVERD